MFAVHCTVISMCDFMNNPIKWIINLYLCLSKCYNRQTEFNWIINLHVSYLSFFLTLIIYSHHSSISHRSKQKLFAEIKLRFQWPFCFWLISTKFKRLQYFWKIIFSAEHLFSELEKEEKMALLVCWVFLLLLIKLDAGNCIWGFSSFFDLNVNLRRAVFKFLKKELVFCPSDITKIIFD